MVSLVFEKDAALIARVKSLTGATWSQSRKFWFVPKDQFNLAKTFDVLQPVAYLDYSAIKENKKSVITQADKLHQQHSKPPVFAVELPPGTESKIEEFGKWMSHKRYSQTSLKNSSCFEQKFFMFLCFKIVVTL